MDIILGIFVIISYFVLFAAGFSLLSYLLDLVGFKSVNAPKKKRNSSRRLHAVHGHELSGIRGHTTWFEREYHHSPVDRD